MKVLTPIILAVVGILLVILLVKILFGPMKWIFKLLLNAVVGYFALMVLNFFGGFVGLSLGLNWINAIVVGVLGIPGVVLLLLFKYLL